LIETWYYVMLAVGDSGVGMFPEGQSRMFEPLFIPRNWVKEPGWVCPPFMGSSSKVAETLGI
jgi:hypothetical protein